MLPRTTDPRLRHEAGHVVASIAHTGKPARARIWRTADGNYGGQVDPGPYPSATARRQIAIAGTVAVCLDAGLEASQITDLLANGELRLPPADVPLADGYTRADLHAVADILAANWTDVLSIADRLIVRELVRAKLADRLVA